MSTKTNTLYYAIKVHYMGCYERTLPYRLEKNNVNEIVIKSLVSVLDANLESSGYTHEVVEVGNGPETFKS